MINPFLPNKYYHFFNRAIGNEKIFVTEGNYYFFLDKLKLYITPIADIYCYCLLPNHYHFLIKIKNEVEIDGYKLLLKESNRLQNDFHNIEDFIMQQFSNFHNSYTKALNKLFTRKGRLFLESFQRKEIVEESYFTKIIHYIHTNPIHHGFVKDFKDWRFSSYNSLLSNSSTQLKREEVFNWFGGKEKFILFHSLTNFNTKHS